MNGTIVVMHKFCKTQFTVLGPQAVATTALQNAARYFKGESFCVFPEPHLG